MGHHPSPFDLNSRNQVLGPDQGGDGHIARRSYSHILHDVCILKHLPFSHPLILCSHYCHFSQGGGHVWNRNGASTAHIYLASFRRHGNGDRIAACLQPASFLKIIKVEDRDVGGIGVYYV